MKRRFGGVSHNYSPPWASGAVVAVVAGLFLLSGIGSVDMAEAAPKRTSIGSVQKTRMKGPKTEKKDPIHINSDKMEAYNKKNLIVFIGNVVAVQGAMQIQSDRLEVYVKKKEKNAPDAKRGPKARPSKTSAVNPAGGPGDGSVERLIATGNVLVKQGKTKYTSSDRLDYKETTGIAVLTGNPRAWENKNQVIGTKIELFLRDGRTVVHGSRRRRVSVTLFPESQPGQSSKRSAGQSPKSAGGGIRGK